MNERKSRDDGPDEESGSDHADWLDRTATILSALLVAALLVLVVRDATRGHAGAEYPFTPGEACAVVTTTTCW